MVRFFFGGGVGSVVSQLSVESLLTVVVLAYLAYTLHNQSVNTKTQGGN
ncbi:hypothetical protein DESHY_110355 [Desulforamulus hydrothermalis Lam5 = DSM 18033]|uniref:Uncharacterized protein n=1 Tax=Desulforamulus hydrothermalis Lam5 = DSM 18033 TaxID=1121428 RepID=K8EFG0_9FIRM|nr:hypothetical protein DESHY_110355 [Desulforamulus hydrothermalis Lam5 = DSM 18033]